MRTLMKVTIPVDSGNTAIENGSLGKTIESILNDLKPEAAYFTTVEGKRSGLIVFDLKDTSQIPAVAEPWFLAFNAKVQVEPVMNREDLKKALSGIETAVRKFGTAARRAA